MKEKLIDKQKQYCLDRLAAAVVEKAIDDWRYLIYYATKVENWRNLIAQGKNIEKIHPKGSSPYVSFDEIRKFFKSENCAILTESLKIKSPDYILKMLEKEKKEAGL